MFSPSIAVLCLLLDSPVTSLQTRAFCRCYALRRVLAPQAELRPRAFHKCTALRQLDLELSALTV